MPNTKIISQKPPNKKRLSRSAIPALVILVIVGLIGTIIYFAPSSSPASKAHGAHEAAITVGTAKAEKNDIAITKEGLGTVAPLVNTTVRTQINGHIVEMNIHEGQIVQKGDFIAEVDPRPYQFTLEQARGTLMRDQALLKEAQLNLERYKTLVEQDSIAKQQLDTQESLVQQYQGMVETDKAQVDQAKLNVEYCRITAPVTGRVGIRQVDLGNYIQTGDANGIVTITQLQPITVLFTLPEDDVPMVMQRLNSHDELIVTIFDRTRSTKLATGKLLAVDNQIDTTTGTVKLRAQFDNADFSLFPNQFVNAALLVNTLRDVITVPSAAIQHGIPGTYVYVVKDDKTVSVRPVKTGSDDGSKVAILDGLAIGEQVVTDGLDKLHDGVKIALAGDAPAADKKKDETAKHHHKPE